MTPALLALWLGGAALADDEPDEPGETTSTSREDVEVEPVPTSDLPVELHAWAAGGYVVPLEPTDAAARGAYLALARLQGRMTGRHFRGFLQVGADNGEVALLDARATWTPSSALALRVGQFKTPVSAEFLIPATELVFVHRGAHTALVPRRALGAEVRVGNVGEAPLGLDVHAGLFGVGGPTPVPGSGELVTGRALLEIEHGPFLHIGAASWMHGADARDLLGEDAPPYDHHLDVAVGYDDHGWTTLAEGVVALDAEGRAHEGGIVTAAHRFPLAHDLDLEPGVSGQVVHETDGWTRVAEAAINLHEDDWHLVQTLEWETSWSPLGTDHCVYVQLQAGL